MKRLLFIGLLVVLSNKLFCQSFEWEVINVGFAFGFQEDKNGYYTPDNSTMTFGNAFRYNWKEKPLSTGIDFTFTGWNRKHDEHPSIHQNAFVFLLTNDYNYTKISPRFTPFGGVGLGYSLIRERGLWTFYTDNNYDKSQFAISPRIGFVVFRRLRFTTEYMYLGNGNNFFNFKLGFVVGKLAAL